MLNKKDNLIIFILALLVISLAVFVMTKDIDLNKNKNQNNNKNIYVSQEQKDNRYELINQNKNVNKIVNQNINQNINTNQQTKIIIDGVDVSDWNIYRNEEYGYSIRYPRDWNAREFPNTKAGADFTKDNDNKIVIDTGGVGEIFFYMSNKLDEEIYKIHPGIQNHESLNSIKEVITYSGIKGYRITWNVSHGSSPDTVSSEMIYFEAKKQGRFKNTTTIQISQFTPRHSQTDEYYKIFDIMIKTFDYIQ
ncbi:MAG: hypothetical protein U9O55_04600 [Patescibacteria group bacterium]|nr:hypothetical protein [Patescibacteria group bacterium]